MNEGRVIVVVAVVLCFLGYRQFTTQQAIRTLEQVPAAARDDGGVSELWPTQGLAAYCEPGHHTVFVFTATWCGGCQSLHAQLPAFLHRRPDVVIRTIDIHDWETAAKLSNICGIAIRSVPRAVIYDADGKLVADDNGTSVLRRWIADEVARGPS